MHASLKAKTNLWLLMLWLAFLVPFLWTTYPRPWAMTAAALVLGVVSGLLQLDAMRRSEDKLVRAETLREVRTALIGSGSGKTYYLLFWLSQIAFLGVSIALLGRHFWAGFLVAYCSFAFGRELVSLKGTMQLERVAARIPT